MSLFSPTSCTDGKTQKQLKVFAAYYAPDKEEMLTETFRNPNQSPSTTYRSPTQQESKGLCAANATMDLKVGIMKAHVDMLTAAALPHPTEHNQAVCPIRYGHWLSVPFVEMCDPALLWEQHNHIISTSIASSTSWLTLLSKGN